MGIFDVIANVLTGGAYGLTQATGQALGGAVRGAQGSSSGGGSSGGGSSTPPPFGPGFSGLGSGADPRGFGLSGTDSGAPCGASAGASGGAAPSGSSLTVQCTSCCAYSVSGDYLLDAHSGDLWLIDKGAEALIPIKKQYSRLDSAAEAMRLSLLKDQMQQQSMMQFASLHHTVRAEIQNQFNEMMSPLDDQIAALRKAAKTG